MKTTILTAGAVLAFCAAAAFAADAPQPAAKSNATAKDTAKAHTAAAVAAEQTVAYDDLGKSIGSRIIVHTKLGTTRTGELIKWMPTSMDIRLDGGAEFTIPAQTVRSVSIQAEPPEPTPAKPGDSSAKKN